MKLLGYVIVQQVTNRLFAGHKHPGKRSTGSPVFVENLENANFDGGKAAIWSPAMYSEAAQIAMALGEEGYSCLAHPVFVEL